MKITGLYSASIRSLVLLAPPGAPSQSAFWKSSGDYSEHRRLMAEMQRLRGRVYLQDGAINQSDLTEDGRHTLVTDEQSWHLLTVDVDGRVLGCMRSLQHSSRARLQDVRAAHTPLANCPTWGNGVLRALRAEINTARSLNMSYLEIGGWAMAEEIRGTTEALRSVLATYAWAQLIGGALGISTATERNGSACILRRLGGRPIEVNGATVPAYFDPHYNCNMEIVRFDSRFPNPRYAAAIEELKATMLNVPVVRPEPRPWKNFGPAFTPSLAVAAA